MLNNQRQHSTLHIQKDVLPYTLYQLLCPVLIALVSTFRMDSISTSYTHSCNTQDYVIWDPNKLNHVREVSGPGRWCVR